MTERTRQQYQRHRATDKYRSLLNTHHSNTPSRQLFALTSFYPVFHFIVQQQPSSVWRLAAIPKRTLDARRQTISPVDLARGYELIESKATLNRRK
jgi:hypothetical protein